MDFQRLFEILPYQEAKYPQKIALAHLVENRWKSYSIEEVITMVQQLSAGLLDLGLKKGDAVGIMTPIGSPIFNFIDFALLQIGVIVVPIHATIRKEQLIFILKDANIKYCFAANQKLYEKLTEVRANALNLKDIYSFVKLKNVVYWKSLLTVPTEQHLGQLQTYRGVIHEDDLATIIYTSGTTGMPKGVLLSHKNIVSNIKSVMAIMPINHEKRVLSFLPVSHVFERMTNYLYIAAGASLYYSTSIETMSADLKKVRPHFFTAVPRLIEKMYDKILETINEKGTIHKKVLQWAIQLGERFQGDTRVGFLYWLQCTVANLFVYRHWRKQLGGKIEGIAVGAAHLQPKLARLFNAAGIKLREGYGLTESSPVVAFNHFEPGMFRFGTVGVPIPGVEVKIAEPNELEEGEIWVKGPSVMVGYHNRPDLTAKVINHENWLKTGDIGKLIDKRFLQITDRRKDIFKTSTGKYIAPQKLENLLKSSPFIRQCMVVGFQKPYITALIVPSFPILKSWCEEQNVHWTAPQFMAINPKVEQKMQAVINELNQALLPHEQIKKITLLHEEWSLENNLMSPTLKVVRANVLRTFSKEIKTMYD